MSHVAAGLPLVTEPLSLVRAGLRDREYSSVRFGDSEPHAILETPGTEMPARRDVASRPNYVWIEGEDAMRPALVPSNSSLKDKFVDLKEKPVVLGARVRRLSSVGACQNDVANTNQFGGFYWIRSKLPQKAVPIPVIYANRGAVPCQNRIGWERQRHDELEKCSAVGPVRRDAVHDGPQLVTD